MLSNNSGYQRIGTQDGPSTELTPIIPSAPPSAEGDFVSNPLAQNDTFSVKVLLKENSYEVSGLSSATTIAELKSSIEAVTHVAPSLQRLISAGKQLKPDNKTLLDFKIVAGASIHLFPLPPPSQATPVATAVEGGTANRPISVNATAAAADENEGGHLPIHFDPFINQTSREVRLWCLILMFLSGMTLFNNLSYISATGKIGAGTLDSIVTIIDTICSALGLVVANMGIQSLRTMDYSDLTKYVQSLVSLALMSVCLRVLWVVDVIMQVQRAVKESQEDAAEDKANDNINTGDEDEDQEPLDSRTVVTFGIQAVLIGLICIFAWGSCVSRARRLQIAVHNYSNANNQV